MNGRRRNALLVGVALVALVLAGAYGARSNGKTVPVRLQRVNAGSFRTTLPETGVVQRPRVVTIPAGVAGNMGDITVKAGDRVREGQLLATIENEQILSNLHDAEDGAVSASGHAQSVAETNAALPEQNRSAVVQAQAAVVQAGAQLQQARQDLVAGSQSGLGYGGQTAEEQRLAADAALEKAATDLREAKRIYDANRDLYAQKGVSRDALAQSQARDEQALVTFNQAQRERQILGGTLSRENQVLHDRVRAAEDALRQAEAQLAAARADAQQSKAGDLQAAQADASRARSDLAFARDQVARLRISAPFDGTIESVATETNDALRPLQPGDAVTTGQPLFTMAAGGGYIVRTRVDEQDIAGVRIGQRAQVGGEDFGGKHLPGHVVAISPIAQRSDDPANTARQVLTTIALDQTLPFLRDGMTVDVDIVTREEPHALTIAVDALRTDDKGANYVFAVRGGRAQRVDVKLGPQNDTSAVVKSGLGPGDVVVADKNPEVEPNVRVTAAPSPTPGATASRQP